MKGAYNLYKPTDSYLNRQFNKKVGYFQKFYNKVANPLSIYASYYYRHCSSPKYRVYRCNKCGSFEIALFNKYRPLKYKNLCPACAASTALRDRGNKQIQDKLNEIGEHNLNIFYNKIYPAIMNRIYSIKTEEKFNNSLYNIIYVLYKKGLLKDDVDYKSIFNICRAYLSKVRLKNKEISFSDLSMNKKLKLGLDLYMEDENGK